MQYLGGKQSVLWAIGKKLIEERLCAGHHNTIAYVAGADPGFFLGGGALVSCAIQHQ